MRKKPVYQDCFSGHLDHQLMGGTGRLSVIYKTARQACPTIQDVFMSPSGCCRLTCYISIKKRHEGEAKNVIGAAIAADPFIKYVVVVDDDVDIYNDGRRAAGDCHAAQARSGRLYDPQCQGPSAGPPAPTMGTWSQRSASTAPSL